jgi:hypothetical protein
VGPLCRYSHERRASSKERERLVAANEAASDAENEAESKRVCRAIRGPQDGSEQMR